VTSWRPVAIHPRGDGVMDLAEGRSLPGREGGRE